MICHGHYQYPGRAAREAARLTLSDSGSLILLHLESGTQTLSLEQVMVSDALGSIPLTLTFPDGGRFTPQHDGQFRTWYFGRRKPGLVHRLERRKRGMVIALVATLLLGFFYLFGVMPWLSSTVAHHIPAQAEKRLGEYTLEMLRRTEGFRDSSLPEDRQKELQRLFQQVTPLKMTKESTPLRLKLMSIPYGANAFMLADGTLIFSDDLVKLAKDDHAIASVMLHEMGHHYHRHPMQMLVRSSVVTLSMMWMMGDVSGIGDTLLQSAAFVDQMQFSRGMEREADEFAINEMRRQHRPLSSMKQIFGALQKEGGETKSNALELPDWLSTHPDMDERLGRIQEAIDRQGEPL